MTDALVAGIAPFGVFGAEMVYPTCILTIRGDAKSCYISRRADETIKSFIYNDEG
jgi:hypothetical protein